MTGIPMQGMTHNCLSHGGHSLYGVRTMVGKQGGITLFINVQYMCEMKGSISPGGAVMLLCSLRYCCTNTTHASAM